MLQKKMKKLADIHTILHNEIFFYVTPKKNVKATIVNKACHSFTWWITWDKRHNSFKFHKNEEKKYNIFTVSFIWSEMLFPKGQFKIFPAPYLHSFIVQTDSLKPVLVDCKQTSSHYWCTVRGPGMGPGTTAIKTVKNATFRI